MRKGRVKAKYDRTYVKEHRTFPTGKLMLLIGVLIVQIIIIIAAFLFDPKPQDIIREYEVTVTPQKNGTLDIDYRFVWEAVDTSEELTWIEIGMANQNYFVYPESVSSTIRQYTQESDDDAVYLVLDLDRAYVGGEVLEFSFKINQRNMLCANGSGYFYEFVPGWFNATPVEHYTFRWAEDEHIQTVSSNAKRQDGYYIWSGSFGCGDYATLNVRYDQNSFVGCSTVPFEAFDSSGAYDSLSGDKTALIVFAFVVVAVLIAVQVWVMDSVVSYHRGRGFLSGHGYYVHAFGRSNPYYVRASDRYHASHAGRSGSRGGGGCACACACACAGGGRAGCSQKDTYGNDPSP